MVWFDDRYTLELILTSQNNISIWQFSGQWKYLVWVCDVCGVCVCVFVCRRHWYLCISCFDGEMANIRPNLCVHVLRCLHLILKRANTTCWILSRRSNDYEYVCVRARAKCVCLCIYDIDHRIRQMMDTINTDEDVLDNMLLDHL